TPLRGAMLPKHEAYPALRHALRQNRANMVNAGTATRGAQKFPRAASVRISLVQRQIGHRLAKPFVLLLEILQLPKLVTAHAAILLAPPVERQFGNADLANGIRHRHALAAQNLNLPKLRDDL